MADTGNLLEHISFSKYVDHYQEFLVSNYWTIGIDRHPAAAYNPGEEFLKTRINGISGINHPSASPLDFNVRGFPSYQTGQTQVPVLDLDLQFVDYEDGSILAFANSWRDAQHNWQNFVANRLEYCVMEMTGYKCNKEGRAVRKYVFKRCLFMSLNYTDEFTEESQLIGDKISINIKAIVYQDLLNTQG